MNNDELQQLKMAWLAAEEVGDKERQLALLRDHPDAQESLIDFIAAFHITEPGEGNVQQVEILPLTQRALATTLERVSKSFDDSRRAEAVARTNRAEPGRYCS